MRRGELTKRSSPAWNALVEEEFGDGMLAAIDFDMTIERLTTQMGTA
jgi:cyanate lyase